MFEFYLVINLIVTTTNVMTFNFLTNYLERNFVKNDNMKHLPRILLYR